MAQPPRSCSLRQYILCQSLMYIRSSGVALEGTVSGESLSTVQLPGSHSRWYTLQGVVLYGTASGSRSRWCSVRGVAIDGIASGESLSSVQPPSSRSRQSSHQGAALYGTASGSRSLRCSLRGVTVYGPAVLSPRSRTRRSSWLSTLSFVRY